MRCVSKKGEILSTRYLSMREGFEFHADHRWLRAVLRSDPHVVFTWSDSVAAAEQNTMAQVPTVADVEELSYIPEIREERRRRDIDMKLMRLFPIFERENSGLIPVDAVGTIMRALNLNPTEAVIQEVIKAIEEPEATGYVKLTPLRNVLLEAAMSREYKGIILVRDGEETIIKAFQAIDRDKKGYIEADYLRQVMVQMGERFNEEEISEMINAAQDPETGHIYYEDFAALLATE
jgi:calmodulin